MFRVSYSSSLHESYDEPEILRCSNPQICPTGAQVRQSAAAKNETRYEITVRIIRDDGSVRTLHEATEAVFDSSGRFIATVGVLQDVTEQVELKSQLKAHEDRLKGIIDHIHGAVYRVKYNKDFTSVFRSNQYQKLFVDSNISATASLASEKLPGMQIRDTDRQRIDNILKEAVEQNQSYELEYSVTLRDGSEKWVSDRGRPVIFRDGETELEGIMIDVTETQSAREALAHSQRLEAIGKLTGGMAHDFNNLLATILGNLELLRDDLTATSQIEFVDAGINSVLRGADLTKNMLAFARKSRLNVELLDLNDLAEKSKNWIGRTLPENIVVETALAPGLWKTETDASSAESALLNLILNARDAMPEGGKLTIETSNVTVVDDHPKITNEDIEPGRYVVLSVRDTGHGIPADNMEKIFEPFFSTKGPGAGSGLGLSMILGFLEQSGGYVRVSSEVGVGTTIRLFFTATTGQTTVLAEVPETVRPLPQGTVKILVVEDEKGVLAVSAANLIQAGYSIETAGSGDEAQALFAANPNFNLLLTDIVMPGAMQGPRLAYELRKQKPDLRVIFLSGYANETMEHPNDLRPEDITLTKPVGREVLLKAVRNALGLA